MSIDTLQKIGQSEKLAYALRVWLEYFVETEAFDRTLPGQFMRGEFDAWTPEPGYRRTSMTFARNRRQEALTKLRAMAIDEETESFARDQVGRLSYANQRRELGLEPDTTRVRAG